MINSRTGIHHNGVLIPLDFEEVEERDESVYRRAVGIYKTNRGKGFHITREELNKKIEEYYSRKNGILDNN
jgi:hypothetical protein